MPMTDTRAIALSVIDVLLLIDSTRGCQRTPCMRDDQHAQHRAVSQLSTMIQAHKALLQGHQPVNPKWETRPAYNTCVGAVNQP